MLFKAEKMKEAAAILQLDVSTLSHWRKKKVIPANYQIKVCKSFNISPKEIIYGRNVSEKKIRKNPRTEYLVKRRDD